ncbi:MAG TPA: class I SAM-dependent methyltransferase [Thermoanaerobaculia bacterium]|nr:class I SAM-dependent methyltransferase [Thermoanaerobaculia bacterium]
MDARLIDFVKRMATLFGLAATRHEGRILPASFLRLCGSEFRDDGYFLDSARREADRLINRFGAGRDSAVLDAGCGFGRLAIGLADRIPDLRRYEGIDVSPAAVAWCRRYIGRRHPNFHFTLIDMHNRRYNPRGRTPAALALPFASGTFDLAYLYSVFSHMELHDVTMYIAELRRLVRTGGGVFATLYVGEGGPEVVVNPADSDRTWTGPLHCVRYRREMIEERFRAAGFAIEDVRHGTETDGQSGYSLRAV